MYPRTNYEMTEEQLKRILEACKPVPLIMLQCGMPSSPQENANRAWASLGEKMGFDSTTVQPIPEKGNRFFTAVPSETDVQREERIKQERRDLRFTKIAKLREELYTIQNKIKEEEEQQKIDDNGQFGVGA